MSLPTFGVRSQQTGETAAQKDDFWNEKNDIPIELAKEVAEYEAGGRYVDSGQQSKEEYHRLHEDNVAARKAYRWPKQEELKAKRIGKIMHMNSLIIKLKMAGIKAWYNNAGVGGMLGLNVEHTGHFPECKHERGEVHYVGAVQVPYMQEFEELYFDQYDVPLGPKRRGWRTILLYLIEQRIITARKADEIFGEPPSGAVSRRYREYVQYLNRRGLGL
jgi:hypothetical protein